MFFIMVAILTINEVTPIWEITETGNFTPFFVHDEGNIAISDKGDIFVLESTSTRLVRYDADGHRDRVVAIMGEGPGELANPLNVRFHEGYFYVLELIKRSIHVYKPDGTHVRDIAFIAPPFMRSVSTVQNGWAVADWEFSPTGKPIEVILYDQNSENPVVLGSWSRVKNDGANLVFVDKTRVAKYNPAKERHLMASSQDGKRLYVAIPGQPIKFLIYDVENKKLLKTVAKEDWRPLPFNDNWGDKRLAQYKEIAMKPGERGGGLRRVSAGYPDYFPVIRYFFEAADGNMVAVRWTGQPDTKLDVVVLDYDLNEIKSELSDEALLRVLAINSDIAFVSTLDDESESAGVAACRLSDVNAFVKSRSSNLVEAVSTGILMPIR